MTNKYIPLPQPISHTPDLSTFLFNLASPLRCLRVLSNVHVRNKNFDSQPPQPPPCYLHSVPPVSQWYHPPPNKSYEIWLQSVSGSIYFLPLQANTSCCSSYTIACPDYFNSLPPAYSPSVVIITFSNLIQFIVHLYLKCSNGFQFPLKQNSAGSGRHHQ